MSLLEGHSAPSKQKKRVSPLQAAFGFQYNKDLTPPAYVIHKVTNPSVVKELMARGRKAKGKNRK